MKLPDWWNKRLQRAVDGLPKGKWVRASCVTHDYDALDAAAQAGVIEQRWLETDVFTHVRDSATGDVKVVPILRREFKRREATT